METEQKKKINWKEIATLICTFIILVCSIAFLWKHYSGEAEMTTFTEILWWLLLVYSVYRIIVQIVSRCRK